MTKLQNRCANCGGKFGLVYHNHWGLRFCRKACRDDFLVKTAKDHPRMRKWYQPLSGGLTVRRACKTIRDGAILQCTIS